MKLKLRAWDKTNKCWIEEFGITNKGEYLCWDNGYVVIPNGHRQKNIEIMQYTGLTDKNGKEIYCGDIVKVLYTDWASKPVNDTRTLEEYLDYLADILVVHYDFNGFYFSTSMGGYSQDMSVGEYGFVEVIGNIYQDSHLSEGAK